MLQIPAGYTYSTILVAGNNITGTMIKFGEALRRLYSKTTNYRKTDFSLNYLGYRKVTACTTLHALLVYHFCMQVLD